MSPAWLHGGSTIPAEAEGFCAQRCVCHVCARTNTHLCTHRPASLLGFLLWGAKVGPQADWRYRPWPASTTFFQRLCEHGCLFGGLSPSPASGPQFPCASLILSPRLQIARVSPRGLCSCCSLSLGCPPRSPESPQLRWPSLVVGNGGWALGAPPGRRLWNGFRPSLPWATEPMSRSRARGQWTRRGFCSVGTGLEHTFLCVSLAKQRVRVYSTCITM